MKWPRSAIPPICPSAPSNLQIGIGLGAFSVARGPHMRGGQTVPVLDCAELSWASITRPSGPGDGA